MEDNGISIQGYNNPSACDMFYVQLDFLPIEDFSSLIYTKSIFVRLGYREILFAKKYDVAVLPVLHLFSCNVFRII